MGRVCKVCTHPKKDDIERALARGESTRNVADVYGLAKDTVARHSKNHIDWRARHEEVRQEVRHNLLIVRQEARADALNAVRHPIASPAPNPDIQTDALFAELSDTLNTIRTIRRTSMDEKTQLMAGRETAHVIELMAKLTGELQAGAITQNILVVPGGPELIRTVDEALRPYPAARLAVAEAMRKDITSQYTSQSESEPEQLSIPAEVIADGH